jgi:LuxR family maltose regulon positive regulatory protein
MLMSTWHHSEDVPVWLSLDESDNDPVMLWWSMIEGVRSIVDDFGDDYRRRLLAVGPAAIDDTVAAVADELGDRDLPVRLFVDDLHLLDRVEPRRSLRSFVDRMPPGTRAAFATRDTSSIPLAKLRVDGELVELGADELALTTEEAEILFSSFGAAVDPDLLDPLLDRARGDPAGVQLAALAIAAGQSPASVVESIDVGDQATGERLVPDVLGAMSADERDFLIATSILRQVSGSLCDAVTGRDDGAALLASLEAGNPFIVPIERSGTWFRTHELFRELLLAELRRGDPALETELHSRAFDWFRDRGDLDPAIHHGLAAGRVDESADMFCAHWWSLFTSGRIETARTLLERFDEEQVAERRPLATAAAFVSGLLGRTRAAREYLAAAERIDDDRPPPDGAATTRSSLAIVRGSLALDGIGPALADAEIAYDLEPPDSEWRGVAALAVGFARALQSDIDGAIPYLEETRSSENEATRSYGLTLLALAALRRGDGARAFELSTEAGELMASNGFSDSVFSATAHGTRSLAEFASGRPGEARASLDVAENAMRFSGRAMPLDALLAHAVLAEAALDLGEHEVALTHLNRATRITTWVPDVGALGTALARLRVRFGREGSPSQSSAQENAPFTERELEVMALLPTALTTREIGLELFLSFNTVKTYLRRIYRKLGASSRNEAVEIARTRDLITIAA